MSTKNRLPDYIDHLQQAAMDACGFVEGLSKDDFLADKRTQQAAFDSSALAAAGLRVWRL